MGEYKNLTVVQEGDICIITINRPKVLNAMNTETLQYGLSCLMLRSMLSEYLLIPSNVSTSARASARISISTW